MWKGKIEYSVWDFESGFGTQTECVDLPEEIQTEFEAISYIDENVIDNPDAVIAVDVWFIG